MLIRRAGLASLLRGGEAYCTWALRTFLLRPGAGSVTTQVPPTGVVGGEARPAERYAVKAMAYWPRSYYESFKWYWTLAR
jgi:hypothetical protein